MKSLPTLKRRSLQVSSRDLVRIEPPGAGQTLPVVLRPAAEAGAVDLVAWASENRQLLEEHLLRSGGLLFRGFDMVTTERLQAFVRAVSGDLLDYQDRATPRSQVEGKIYSSTDYPPDQTIELHNENCYAANFPKKIFFNCQIAAAKGGATPIADCRQVYRLIPEAIRDRFARVGVQYVRNYVEGLGLSWREVFQTDDREAMEAYCRQSGIEVEWVTPDHLRTRQRRPAIGRHPQTGDWIWLNQAVAFHISTVDPAVREGLIRQLTEEGVPKNSCYGDGSPIEPEVLDALRTAYRGATVDLDWQRGDLAMLDNLLTAHGRRPFEGSRKVVVGMSEPVAGEDVYVQPGEAA